ncbi:chitin synthase [Candidatus Kaiserbacteria bacterium CG10_big_fil_rev_8_21_14_0_10_51_14]|uniref:Chitin synthase n=1 Tax=Candidatus Kaiserbacteria bacterium CG10_big_fil_rev_8_21_14_0_10_51_14 TaxID=1974610 RepID=A0A2H0UCJ1_9BACT|nr:MAG: chitin synthase [Candidatus Kaiserbacteria bacterium CG10_big_fil_rev_8_21_14_0_10_51_14]
MSSNFSIKSLGQSARTRWNSIVQDFGPWFLFFLVIYVILLLKVVTYHTIYDHFFFGFYSILITTYILSRFILSYLHKPISYDPNYQPSVTFVVPAKNEEDNIAETIRRFAEVEYPKEKIEVIAINDGSTDRTLEHIVRTGEEIKNNIQRFEVVDWKENRGKRHGMAEGVLRARHDIVIFVDSDSFIEPDCVKHLTKYFSDNSVGAVSGHTDVYNRDTNVLTQMQAIRYYIAFRVYKAAESVFGTVTCCPGCCSAYRRAYLLPFINEWLNQSFLGERCTFGDDRSLTNFMIRKYRAVYSKDAKAHTVVPENFGKYLRQQQRWKKSWVRETFIASTFMWKMNPIAAVSFYSYVFLAFSSPIVFFRALVWYPLMFGALPIVYLFGLLLMLLLHGLYYRIHVGPRAWLLAICNFWFNTVILMWQLPWAVITIRDSRWGTR